MTENICTT